MTQSKYAYVTFMQKKLFRLLVVLPVLTVTAVLASLWAFFLLPFHVIKAITLDTLEVVNGCPFKLGNVVLVPATEKWLHDRDALLALKKQEEAALAEKINHMLTERLKELQEKGLKTPEKEVLH